MTDPELLRRERKSVDPTMTVSVAQWAEHKSAADSPDGNVPVAGLLYAESPVGEREPRSATRPGAADRGPAAHAVLDALRRKAATGGPSSSGGGSAPLPEQLRTGIETLGAVSMDGVRVHANSPEPARIGALAYAEGSNIYLGPGQHDHLSHEAWHIAQQRQGRVGSTEQLGGVALNDDHRLEREADAMGRRAAGLSSHLEVPVGRSIASTRQGPPVVQRVIRGLHDIKSGEDVPDGWVDLYIADLTDDHMHLYEGDIVDYLISIGEAAALDHVTFENTDGNHWDLTLTGATPDERISVRTKADGNCGVHAIHAILNRGTIAEDDDQYVAPHGYVADVRGAIQVLLTGHANEIKARIVGEIGKCDYVFLTGFGPNLQGALQAAADVKVEQGAKAAAGKEPLEKVGHTGLDGHQPAPSGKLLPEIAVWQLLARPADQIRSEMAKWNLPDRKALGRALKSKFKENIQAWVRLPDDVIEVTIECLLLLPTTEVEDLKSSCSKYFGKDQKLPKPIEEFAVAGDKLKKNRSAGQSELIAFINQFGYARSKTSSVHQLFGHDVLTIYPIEKKEPDESQLEEWQKHEKAKTKAPQKAESMRSVVHRPILDLEIVGGKAYARCYLGLHSAGGDDRKDVTADAGGAISMNKVGLMNLGNPFKALLWCEDYLSSSEHDKFKPDPIIRSFLIPLSDATWMMTGGDGPRPLDQDRGSGQFGNTGQPNLYGEKLKPLVGSLVSFFLNIEHLVETEPNQEKLPMSILQHYLLGSEGDPRAITKTGIAAQHGRKGHEATFGDAYEQALVAYYTSLEGTGFTDATQGDGGIKTGKWKKKQSEIRDVHLAKYRRVMELAEKMKVPVEPTLSWV